MEPGSSLTITVAVLEAFRGPRRAAMVQSIASSSDTVLMENWRQKREASHFPSEVACSTAKAIDTCSRCSRSACTAVRQLLHRVSPVV